MSTTTPLPTLPPAAAEFLATVAQALSDLPDGEREDLIEEVGAHLADVSDELGQDIDADSLRARLGPPEAYAAELRSAAGYDAPAPEQVGIVNRLGGLSQRLRARAAALPGAEGVRRLTVELRPGWWVARVWVLLTWVSLDNGIAVFPRVTRNGLVNLLLLAAAVVASVWLGRRVTAPRPSRGWRGAAIAANVILAIGAIVVFNQIQQRGNDGYVGEPKSFAEASLAASAPSTPTNLFAFTPDGKLIPQFYLYDENGQPVDLGDATGCADASPTPSLPFDNAYPREQYIQKTDSFGNLIQDCVPAGRTPGFSVAIPSASSSPSPSASAG
jgi:hypothetical protein